MSISTLQNAPWLNMNVGSVAQSIPLNTILGNCTFLGTAVLAANYTLKAYILGDFAVLNVSIPSTAATAATAITFANALPANLRPTNVFVSGQVGYSVDADTAGDSKPCSMSVATNGTLSFALSANATNTEHYNLVMTAMYPLV